MQISRISISFPLSRAAAFSPRSRSLGAADLHGDLGITFSYILGGQKLDFHPHLHCIVTGEH
jgi:hypothetical protein